MAQVEIVGLKALRDKMRRLADATKRGGSLPEGIRQRLTVAWRSGGEAFVRTAIRNVLVDTGMSAASFFPLSRALTGLHAARAGAAIEEHTAANIKRNIREGEPTFPSGRRVTGFQDRRAGRRLGRRAFQFITPAPGARRIVFKFSFQIVVYQHSVWDDVQQSLPKGLNAFRNVVRARFEKDARFIINQIFQGRRLPAGFLTGGDAEPDFIN